MTPDPKAKDLLDRHADMTRNRDNYDAVFQEIKDLVRPDTCDFAGGNTKAQEARKRMFDGTAPWSLDQLASGLHSHLSSPVDLWFMLGVVGTPYAKIPFEGKKWLEDATEIIYSHYSNPNASFNPVMHEGYMDIAGFGTTVVYQWLDEDSNTLCFRTYPLADCWIAENYKGQVDTVHRTCKYSVRQIEQEFGFIPEGLSKMRPSDKVTVIHEVRPREDADRSSRSPKQKPWSSLYVCKDTGETLRESGYDWMPYHVPRWAKIAGEVYGRSPALSVLPEIRMVNAMSKTMIMAAQKMVDPPLMVEDDGYLLPVRTNPGGINFRRPGSEPIMPLPTAQRIDVGVEMVEQRREMIRRGFYIDWLVRPTKKERQTAQEIMDDRNQMLSMLGPIVGRLQGELLGPMITLSFNLLSRAGLIDPAPAMLDGANIELVYISPAAKAQTLTRGQGLMHYLQQVTQLLPVMPNLIHSIDEDALNAELQDQTDAPRRVLLDPEEARARREQAAQAQQAQQVASVAPPMAKAARDFAEARQIDPTLGNQ